MWAIFNKLITTKSRINSASYPQQDKKWVVCYLVWVSEWKSSMADRGDAMSASCTAGPIVC